VTDDEREKLRAQYDAAVYRLLCHFETPHAWALEQFIEDCQVIRALRAQLGLPS
jgi:hypothetical protein